MKLSGFVLGFCSENWPQKCFMNVSSSGCLLQNFVGVHNLNESGSETLLVNKDLLHMKIKGNMVFKGVKIEFAFPGLCCSFNDHKG